MSLLSFFFFFINFLGFQSQELVHVTYGVVRDVKFLQNKRGREVFLFVGCLSVLRSGESWLISVKEGKGGTERQTESLCCSMESCFITFITLVLHC